MERIGSIGKRAGALIAAFVVFAIAGSPALAGSKNATARCDAAKTKFAAEVVDCVQKNHAKEILTGESLPPCNNLPRLEARWAALEARFGGACSTEGTDFIPVLFAAAQFNRDADLAIRPPTKVILYDAGASPDGDFLAPGPFSENPLSCPQAMAQAGLECIQVAPLASTDDGPLWANLQGLPSSPFVPIVSRSGVKIADGSDDFLDGTWDACLQESAGPDCAVGAGVLPDGTYWWHGSDSEGSDSEANCFGFHSDDPIAGTAYIGRSDADGADGHLSQWGDPEQAGECDGSNLPAPTHLVCACASR